MKYIFSLAVFVSFSFVANAQSNINLNKNYRQKLFIDSLQKTFKESALEINPQPSLVYNMPVAPLENDGEEVGLSSESTLYRMKTDRMLIVKPETKTTYIPNPVEEKKFLIRPGKRSLSFSRIRYYDKHQSKADSN